jgi:hypothetical protein
MYALLQHCCAAALVVALPSAEAQLGTTDHRAAASSLAAPSSAYAVSVRSVPSCWLCCCYRSLVPRSMGTPIIKMTGIRLAIPIGVPRGGGRRLAVER